MELNDEELITLCRANDESAWEILVRRYRRLIYAIPRRAGLDEDVSGDVFQQVFALLVENLDRIKQPSQIQAWLVTTARRETLRILKGQKAQKAITFDRDDEGEIDELTNLPDKSLLADEIILRLEEQNRVRAAVEALDEKCRRLL